MIVNRFADFHQGFQRTYTTQNRKIFSLQCNITFSSILFPLFEVNIISSMTKMRVIVALIVFLITIILFHQRSGQISRSQWWHLSQGKKTKDGKKSLMTWQSKRRDGSWKMDLNKQCTIQARIGAQRSREEKNGKREREKTKGPAQILAHWQWVVYARDVKKVVLYSRIRHCCGNRQSLHSSSHGRQSLEKECLSPFSHREVNPELRRGERPPFVPERVVHTNYAKKKFT